MSRSPRRSLLGVGGGGGGVPDPSGLTQWVVAPLGELGGTETVTVHDDVHGVLIAAFLDADATSTSLVEVPSAPFKGAFIGGRAQARDGDSATLSVGACSGFVHGLAYNYGADASIRVVTGAFAGFAQGYAKGYDGTQGIIESGGAAAFAQGFAYGNTIEASGAGSFAQGYAGSGNIVASAAGSVQFGPGTNDLAQSLRVGVGPWLVGTAGAPASPVNGQIWIDDGDVVIRSGGVSVVIS